MRKIIESVFVVTPNEQEKKAIDIDRFKNVITTLGSKGCSINDKTCIKAIKVRSVDTTGAGDSFCAGASIGLTYGKSLREACEIGSMLAASVIVTTESVCPRFLPRELGLDMDVVD